VDFRLFHGRGVATEGQTHRRTSLEMSETYTGATSGAGFAINAPPPPDSNRTKKSIELKVSQRLSIDKASQAL
jgi:hypothetical protein